MPDAERHWLYSNYGQFNSSNVWPVCVFLHDSHSNCYFRTICYVWITPWNLLNESFYSEGICTTTKKWIPRRNRLCFSKLIDVEESTIRNGRKKMKISSNAAIKRWTCGIWLWCLTLAAISQNFRMNCNIYTIHVYYGKSDFIIA